MCIFFGRVSVVMRASRVVSIWIISFVLGLMVSQFVAAEELDTDLMQTIEDTNKSLSSNISLQRQKPSIEDAESLNKMFDVVEGYFVRKGDAQNAVDLTKKSKQLAEDIAKLAGEKNFDAATNLATDLSRACKSCHTFYKKE